MMAIPIPLVTARLQHEDTMPIESRFGTSFVHDRDYLNGYVFANEAEARELLARFFHDYNHEKPQERLGWKTPTEYRQTFTSNES